MEAVLLAASFIFDAGRLSPSVPAQNVFAPVLGGGRVKQPGADGGDTRDLSLEMVQREALAPPPTPFATLHYAFRADDLALTRWRLLAARAADLSLLTAAMTAT